MSNKRAMFLPTIIGALFVGAGMLLFHDPVKSQTNDIEAIVFDIHNGEILAAQSGKGFVAARPVGSLAKPLVAYALLSSGKSGDDVFLCRASSPDEQSTKTCWYKPGHGNLTFVPALGKSCNAWFRQWLHGVDSTPVINLFDSLGILGAEELASFSCAAGALCGLEGNLPIPGLNYAAGFATLFNGGIVFSVRFDEQGVKINPVGTLRIDTEAVDLVAAGMRECGAVGTGSAFGEICGSGPALVKTGTAYAMTRGEADKSRTDGWCIALYPAGQPRYLVLLRLPGGNGAEAAAEAARFLRAALDKTQ